MCNVWKIYKDSHKSPEEELTTAEIEKIFDDGIFSKVQKIALTGGEPFLRNDLVHVVDILHDRMPKSSFGITTNGFLTDRVLEFSEEITNQNIPLSISVSIDGFSATHNAIRGVPYAYDRAIKTLEELIELRKCTKKLHLGVSYTITPQNLEDVRDFRKFVADRKTDFSWKLAQVSEILFHNRDSAYIHDSAKLKDKLLLLTNETELYPEKFYHEGILSLLYGVDVDSYLIPCESGSYSFYLDPYGNVYPCGFWNRVMGNLKTTRFRNIWKSELAEKIRADAYQRKCPSCWNGCELWQSVKLHPYKWIKWYVRSRMLGKRRF
jgi:MoaA/NifB/PqqE/SkfB family radical SAM enzyme